MSHDFGLQTASGHLTVSAESKEPYSTYQVRSFTSQENRPVSPRFVKCASMGARTDTENKMLPLTDTAIA